jgi:outer membrane lipoprotein-sorting protein
MRNKLILIVMLMLSALCSVHAEDTPNSRQARRIFNQAYQQVFGEQGATLRYDVNIIGIYKTNGTIWFKGKKKKFEDSKVISWNDGTTIYSVKKNKKKKEVEIHSAQNNKSDKYSRKFKFDPENFDYSVAEDDEGLMLTLKAKKGKKGIKEAQILVERKTYHPIRLRIKIAFIWTTIKISNFHSGDISDEILRFPKEQYSNYKFEDKR